MAEGLLHHTDSTDKVFRLDLDRHSAWRLAWRPVRTTPIVTTEVVFRDRWLSSNRRIPGQSHRLRDRRRDNLPERPNLKRAPPGTT